jgi:hypothetical protein
MPAERPLVQAGQQDDAITRSRAVDGRLGIVARSDVVLGRRGSTDRAGAHGHRQ